MPDHSSNERRPVRKGASENQGRSAGPRLPRGKRPPREQDRGRASAHGWAQPHKPERIAKVMARAGLCSRRDAEQWIGDGRVAVNGVVLKDPAINIGATDKVTIDGEPIAQRARTRLFLFHKPRGLVSTERDPEGRKTVFDYLREHWPEGPRVVSVGRLDINTEGLLLLTNDGGLARVLELPSTGWLRRYRVRANGTTDQATLDRLSAGLTIDGITYGGIEAVLDRLQGANCWLTLALREGKNREIKRVLEHIGLAVNRLIRLSFGPFQLGDLPEGAVEEVRSRVLRDQLGPSLAKAAGVDFSSPIGDEPRGETLWDKDETFQDKQSKKPRKDRARRDLPEPGPRAGCVGHRDKPREQASKAGARAKPQSGPRKHISALREQAAPSSDSPRKRIERRETADRTGRVVAVERLVPAASDSRCDPVATRNGRRFAAERREQVGGSEEASRHTGRKPAGARPAKDQDDERSARSRARKPKSAGKRPMQGLHKHERGPGAKHAMKAAGKKPGGAGRALSRKRLMPAERPHGKSN